MSKSDEKCRKCRNTVENLREKCKNVLKMLKKLSETSKNSS